MGQSRLSFYQVQGKRLLDLLLGSLALLIFLPILAVVALIVWTSLGRPIFFVQTRSGKGGQAFQLTKFRTLEVGDGAEETRLTPVGSFLRKSGLDELPQLIHVISGKMSLVGPRALLPEYDALYSPEHVVRLSVRPGITGLVQIKGGKWLSWQERLDLDSDYSNNISFASDMHILLKTIPALISSSRRGQAPEEFQRLDDVIKNIAQNETK